MRIMHQSKVKVKRKILVCRKYLEYCYTKFNKIQGELHARCEKHDLHMICETITAQKDSVIKVRGFVRKCELRVRKGHFPQRS